MHAMSDHPGTVSSAGTERDADMVAPDGSPRLHLDCAELSFTQLDRQTRLLLGCTEVIIETPSRLITDRGRHVPDPDDRAGLGPRLALYPWHPCVSDDHTQRHVAARLHVRRCS
jgi:hypothetical protein